MPAAGLMFSTPVEQPPPDSSDPLRAGKPLLCATQDRWILIIHGCCCCDYDYMVTGSCRCSSRRWLSFLSAGQPTGRSVGRGAKLELVGRPAAVPLARALLYSPHPKASPAACPPGANWPNLIGDRPTTLASQLLDGFSTGQR